MDLERINIALRPRGEWEAIDLGLRLAQRHAGVLYPAWLMSSAPFALLIGIVFIHFGDPLLAYLVFWWSKPLFDRVLLFLYGSLIFDDIPDRKKLRRIAFRMPYQAAWIRAISWGRFDFSRSFNLPVWQLEGLRGRARSQRSSILNLGAGGAAIMLSLSALAAVLLLYLALIAFVMSFVVGDVINFDFWSVQAYMFEIYETLAEGGAPVLWTSFAIYYLCEGFLAPLYVGAGFSLYLNRRTHIEAWDVELQFRRAIKRRGLGAIVAVLVGVTLLVAPAGAPAAHAQDQAAGQAATEEARNEIRAAIEEILEDASFGRTVKRTIWREKGEPETRQSEIEAEENSRLSVFFGSLVEVILWAVVLVGLVTLIVSRSRWLPWFRGDLRQRRERAGSVAGLLLDEGELPTDLAAEVHALWNKGRRREAASLLYRGTLTILNNRYSLKVHDGDTEGDCMRLVRAGTDSAVANFFARVARNWQAIAYAHQMPDDSDIEMLCTDFRATLEPTA